MLILDGPYPPWNTRHTPSPQGSGFLQALDALSFGGGAWLGTPLFVDEFELLNRNDDERAGWPDWAVLWPDRLWLIELKTETGSHRNGQLARYLDLARHHHPGKRIDLTYLTPPMPPSVPDAVPGGRSAHVSWPEVTPLIRTAWEHAGPDHSAFLAELSAALDTVGTDWATWRHARLAVSGRENGTDLQHGPTACTTAAEPFPADDNHLRAALLLAEKTGRDGDQRALDLQTPTPAYLHTLGTAVRDAITTAPVDSPLHPVTPWVWHTTSTGKPLTTAGRETGYELRFSRRRTRPTRTTSATA